MDQASEDLILSLQAQDLADLQRASRGEGTNEAVSDADLALRLYNDELRCHAVSVSDHAYSARLGEAERDNGRETSDFVSSTPAFDHVIAQTEETRVPSDSQQNIGHDIGGSSVSPQSEITTAIPIPTCSCVSCSFQGSEHHFVHAPCGHDYCEDCLTQVFSNASENEAYFPPRCCKQEISLTLAMVNLDEDLINTFTNKALEYGSTNRTYCSNKFCGLFIPHNFIEDEAATCTACNTMTCAICKAVAHRGGCSVNKEHEVLAELARKEGYQKCYKCKRLIELNTGCNHMT